MSNYKEEVLLIEKLSAFCKENNCCILRSADTSNHLVVSLLKTNGIFSDIVFSEEFPGPIEEIINV